MNKLFTFQKKYGLWTLLLLGVEIGIAVFVEDRFVRPYLGDVLVVMLLYCFVKTFLNIRVWAAAIGVLIFAFVVEGLQYVKIVEVLGLQDNTFARIVIGTSFSWGDLLAYTLGIGLVLLFEKIS